jgi:hypothetical protein
MSVSEMSTSDAGAMYPDAVLASEVGMSESDGQSCHSRSQQEVQADSDASSMDLSCQLQLFSDSMSGPAMHQNSSSSALGHQHIPINHGMLNFQSNTPRGGFGVPVPITKLDIESRLLGRSLRSLAELSAYSSTNGMDAGGSSALPTSGVDKTEDSDLESESYLGSEKMDLGD